MKLRFFLPLISGWILLLLGLNTSDTFAQGVIEGVIIDEATQAPVPFANILIVNSVIGTTADEAGRFSLFVEGDCVLRISQLNYQEKKYYLKWPLPPGELRIALTRRTASINEVVVTGKEAEEKAIQREAASILDFLPLDSVILAIDTRSSFSENRLSILSPKGAFISAMKIPKEKKIQRFYQSCNKDIYVLSKQYAYRIIVHQDRIALGDRMGIDSFELFVKPCRARVATNLYYLTALQNGLVDLLKYYQPTTGEIRVLHWIGNKEAMTAYQYDLSLIRRGNRTSSMDSRSYEENQYLRSLQEDADFYGQVFYKPKYPNFVFSQQQEILLFDHLNQEILTYQDTVLQHRVAIQYIKGKKWKKRLIKDQGTHRIFGIFQKRFRLELREIDSQTGAASYSCSLDCDLQQISSVKVHNNTVYYLQRNAKGQQLLKYKEAG